MPHKMFFRACGLSWGDERMIMSRNLGFMYTSAFLLVSAMLLSAGCVAGEAAHKPIKPICTEKPFDTVKPTCKPSETEISHAEALLQSLSLEEKIGQLINIRCDEKNLDIIKRFHLGGVTLFETNFRNEAQVKKLCADIQAQSEIPLFIAVDEEGGRVSRLKYIYNESSKSAFSIGQTKDSANAYNSALSSGAKLAALGINMNFAPVADIWSNPNNTVIGDRAYGSTPELVSDMVASAVKGFQAAGVLSIIKHFPGHGDTFEDSHERLAVYKHDEARFRSFELLPFISGINAGADGIMAAHVSAPQITHNNEPADFQPFFLKTILREELGYKKLIITDALDMAGITNEYTPAEASLKAFKAGADILLLPPDVPAVVEALVIAVKKGEITEERLNSSVLRILIAKGLEK
jgi:beta-N-acetylhexosaminidase